MTQIPDPLPPPPTDAGQGEWGSQPLYSRADDILFANVAANASLAADAAGWTNAAAHLDHYLDNSGEVLYINADAVLRDVPEADGHANGIVRGELRRVVADVVAQIRVSDPRCTQHTPSLRPWIAGDLCPSSMARPSVEIV